MADDRILTPEVIEYRKNLGKVSPVKVAEMLGQPLHKGQKDIAKYFEEPLIHTYHDLNIIISRRWGKTFLGKVLATTAMLTPNSQILLVTFSTTLSEIWWKDILHGLMSLPALKDKVKWDKKAGIIEIPELNTLFVCCSHLNYDTRGIGRQFSTILYDERALIPPQYQQEIYDLVTPTQTNYGSKDGIKYGKQITMTTPRGSITGSLTGLNFLKGLNGEKGYVSFTKNIYDSPFLTAEEIEHLRLTTSLDSWNQEYMCQFSKTTKTVFRNYNKDKHVINMPKPKIKEMAPHCEMIIALDFGAADGDGSSIVLYNNKQDTYYVIDEHYAKNEITRDFFTIMKGKAEYWAEYLEIPFDSIIWFYDPSALYAAQEACKIFNLTLNKAKNKRTEGVDYINELLQGIGDEQIPRLYFLDTCETHISMFEYAEFKVISGVISNQFAKDPSERQSHYECCVTTIYACYSHNKTSNNTLIIT